MGETTVERLIGTLLENGYGKLTGVVDPSVVERMNAAALRLRTRESESWDGAAKWFADAEWRPTYFAGEGKNTNFYDCLGLDPSLDAAAEDLIATPEIRALRDEVLGRDHRLWYAQFRWADPGGEEYRLHQDVYGELAFCVYLSEHPDPAGSMVFWPGSHRWPRILESFPHLYPHAVAGRLGHVDGVAGDICVFFNKTWHGRTSAVDRARLVFLISFIPPGPIEKARRMPESSRASLGPELRRVTAPDAARPFGDRPPAEPPLSCTFEELPAGTVTPGTAASESFARALRETARDLSPAVERLVEQKLAALGLDAPPPGDGAGGGAGA